MITSAASWPASRVAVSALFLMNGYVMGSWATLIPEVKKGLDLTEGNMGLLFMCFGIGSLVFMAGSGAIIARAGSRRLSIVTALLAPWPMLLTINVPAWSAVAPALFLFGGLMGSMDIAMNANAVAVEKHIGRAIMSSCHAFWSLGTFTGAALGGTSIATLGLTGHVLFATAVGIAIVLWAARQVLDDAPQRVSKMQKPRLQLTPLPWLIGIIGLCSMIPEGAIRDWGALYLRGELQVDTAWSGAALAAFSTTMFLMRFAGDAIRSRLGAVLTLRICATVGCVGLLTAGLADNLVLAMMGFALAGIGISNIVPIAFSAGGNLPGISTGVSLSIVTSLGYCGMLMAPSLIGFIAEYASFATIFATLGLLFIIVLTLSPLARHADGNFGPKA